MLFNIIQIFGWIIFRNDNVIHTSGYILIPIIFIYFNKPQVLVCLIFIQTYISDEFTKEVME